MSNVNQNDGPSALRAFDFHPRTRIVFGTGSVDRVGELARELGGKSVLLVTDAGIVAAGHAARVKANLESARLRVMLFDRVRENPTTKCVEDCVAVAKLAGVNLIVGLGGGSSMDTAKGCNFIFTNGGRMQDYWGVGKATEPMLPLIAIPTTAGTGSECQSAALIADEKTHQKMACLDPKAAARVAILDPALTLSQPPRVAACTGVDAIAHALETAVTQKRNALSLMYSREAFRLCITALPEVMANRGNLDARGQMQLGAAFAGLAIENSMLGAAHSAANPLTAHFDIVHGQAVGMMLPHVVRFNGADRAIRDDYAALAIAAGITKQGSSAGAALKSLIARLEEVLRIAGLARSLEQCGVPKSSIPILAEEATRQWTANFNPRSVSSDDFVALYTAAFPARAAASTRKPANKKGAAVQRPR
jgi:alcohol dehydrogenase